MSEFWLYFKLGLEHVLDWQAYDHILFLIVLVACHTFHGAKRVIWLVTLFTLGHTLSLFLSVYGIVSVNTKWVEFLIAASIFITAVFNIVTAKKMENKKDITLLYVTSLFFGVIHGLGFSTYFKVISAGTESKFLPLLEFALGIEAAQLIVVIIVLILAFIFQGLFGVSRRDWILVVSSIVIGVILPILIENYLAL
ncbi:HupE/UreJ family protein [Salinimicrobium catena]|uniref:HupE/UreJ family protein n=1 Tax=Salinimicrobium catena TaxID=390640 RepID=UPI002FE4A58D